MSEAAGVRPRFLDGTRDGRRLQAVAAPEGHPASGRRTREAPCVPRPRLVRVVMEARTPLVLLAAPAGYGKTTLLCEWDRADPRPFHWLTLDRRSGAPGELVAAVEHALGESAPDEHPGSSTARRVRPAASSVALDRIARAVARRAPFVLVIDDLHCLRSSGAQEVLHTLVRHLPSGSALALASRTEPALPIARMRANRALTELRARDLAMTTHEAAALLAQSGIPHAKAHAVTLAYESEGWPAGLYLASVALQDEPDVAGAVARFGGDDTIVADYLRDEVLAALPAATVSFLERASTLEELSGPVCDFVLETSGSAKTLASVERREMLLAPLDRKSASFRWHRLLRAMLRAELRRTDAQGEERLHRRASDWYAARGDAHCAASHAVAAHDAPRAAAILGRSAPQYVSVRRNATLEDWLSRFTVAEIAGLPALALAAANSDLLKGELAAVQRWESATRRALHERPAAKRTPAHEASVALLRAVVGGEGVRQMGVDAARARELAPEDSSWRPLCCLLEGVSHYLTGEADAAEASLEEGARRGAVAAPNVQTLCLAQLSLMASERGEPDSAAAYAARAAAQVEHYTLSDYPSSALVFAASAAAGAARGKVEAAQHDARRTRDLLSALTDFMPWYQAETRIALASATARLSDSAAARELLAAASGFARRIPDAVVLPEKIERMTAWLETAPARPTPLTTAELRILGFLPTHLSFREIAARLCVSANTVKTQAHAVYRKLDAASRSEAVAQAVALGLLDCGDDRPALTTRISPLSVDAPGAWQRHA